jgi:hypothetical protein
MCHVTCDAAMTEAIDAHPSRPHEIQPSLQHMSAVTPAASQRAFAHSGRQQVQFSKGSGAAFLNNNKRVTSRRRPWSVAAAYLAADRCAP